MKIILFALLAGTALLSGCEGNLMTYDHGSIRFYRVTDCEVSLYEGARVDYSVKGVQQSPLHPQMAICHMPQSILPDVVYEPIPGCCGQEVK